MRGIIVLLATVALSLAPTVAAETSDADDAAGHCVKASADWGAQVSSYGCLQAVQATVDAVSGGPFNG